MTATAQENAHFEPSQPDANAANRPNQSLVVLVCTSMATGPHNASSAAGCVFLAARVAFCFVVVALFTLMVASCMSFFRLSGSPTAALIEMLRAPASNAKFSADSQRYPFVRNRDTDT